MPALRREESISALRDDSWKQRQIAFLSASRLNVPLNSIFDSTMGEWNDSLPMPKDNRRHNHRKEASNRMSRAPFLLSRVQLLLLSEDGQDLIEYALVAAIVVLGATAGMQALATALNKVFVQIIILGMYAQA